MVHHKYLVLYCLTALLLAVGFSQPASGRTVHAVLVDMVGTQDGQNNRNIVKSALRPMHWSYPGIPENVYIDTDGHHVGNLHLYEFSGSAANHDNVYQQISHLRAIVNPGDTKIRRKS